MKEHPILFSGEMVRAILDGRKTMTRRVIKNQPGPTTVGYTELLLGHFKPVRSLRAFEGDIGSDDHKKALEEFWADEKNETLACPYGQPGNRLWVRENFWAVEVAGQGVGNQFLVYDEEMGREPRPKELRPTLHLPRQPLRWGHHSSIHMPRWASRITLEITAVRVERLRGITESDAWNEGIRTPNPVAGFMLRWEDLNLKRGYGWDDNPWVWVISFRRP